MNILSKLSIVVYRTCVVLFVALFATSLYAQGVPTSGGDAPAQEVTNARELIFSEIRNLLTTRHGILNDPNRPVAERAGAFADMMLGGGLLIRHSDEQIQQLITAIDADIRRKNEILAEDVLPIVRFDTVMTLINEWGVANAATKVPVLESVGEALRDVGTNLVNVDDAVRQKIVQRQMLQTGLLGIQESIDVMTGDGEARAAIEIAKNAVGAAMARVTVEERVAGVESAVTTLRNARVLLGRDGNALRFLLYEELFRDGGVFDWDERIKELQDRLAASPEDYGLWRELTELRLTHLNMTRTAIQEEWGIDEEGMQAIYEIRVLMPLNEAQEGHPEIQGLAYLHAFYSGWVNEYFGHYGAALGFLRIARENATNERDEVRAEAKITELILKTRLEAVMAAI